MFKKIVSNLPFHPTLLGDLGYYLRRVKQESAIRRLGFIFVLLALAIQMFAFMSPVESSLAYSTADIVYGATSKEDIIKAYKKNKDPQGRTDIKPIFDYYGIGLSQIEQARKTVISDSDNEKYVNTSRSSSVPGGNFTRISGAIDGGIYEFPLKNWNKSEFPNGYPAITGISSYGFRFWVLLKGCGNIVIEKGAKHPAFQINKKLMTASSTRPGETVKYAIEFRNNGIVASENVRIVDVIDKNYQYDSYTSNIDLKFNKDGQRLTWEVKGKNSALSPSERWHRIVVNLKVSQAATAGTKICNQATIKGSRAADASSGNQKDCVSVTIPTCPGTGLPIPDGGVDKCIVTCPDGSNVPYNKACPVPQLTCQSFKEIGRPSWNSRKFETVFLKQPGGNVKAVKYYVNDRLAATQNVPLNANSDYYIHQFNDVGKYLVRAELVPDSGNFIPSQSCQIEVAIDQPTLPIAQIVTDKKVSNVTKVIEDANNSTAGAGDILKYTLIIENTGDGPANNLVLNGEYAENIGDILEYSNLLDKQDAAFNPTTQTLSWAAVNLAPGDKVVKSFTVQVKNPIPATPISASNPLSFDYSMRNIYGREVIVNLSKPASKNVEVATTYLPNTGPGTGLIASTIFTTIVGYFFFRARLMSRELEIIRYEYSTGGF